MFLGASVLISCTPDDDAPDWLSEEPDITAHALLDWDTGYIEYPLQTFAMSADEYSVVAAAQNIVFVRCVVGDAAFPVAEMARTKLMLATPNRPRVSPYGLWSAELVAVRGYLGSDGVLDDVFWPGSTLGEEFDDAVIRCSVDDAVVYLRPQQMGQVYNDDEATYFESLTSWHFDSVWAALRDSRVAPYSVSLGECFKQQGYSPQKQRSGDSDPPLWIQMDESWSGEKRLQAGVTAAICNDQLGVTQALSDIRASYQQLIIDENEAELLAIRAEVELRLERAHQVLRQAGLE